MTMALALRIGYLVPMAVSLPAPWPATAEEAQALCDRMNAAARQQREVEVTERRPRA